MKTFKLKSLIIVNHVDKKVEKEKIPLIDGLIINREDGEDQWLIEAYVSGDYEEYFKELEKKDDVMIQVKITKETNDPATFITTVTGLNSIGENMNVLFLGEMVDLRRGEAQNILEKLVHEGYEGEDLIERFQRKMKMKQ
ncbi:MAG TPA: YwpF family protein [Bacillota bacterium]|nr:YwpF family protein [Bacillota bacterium]